MASPRRARSGEQRGRESTSVRVVGFRAGFACSRQGSRARFLDRSQERPCCIRSVARSVPPRPALVVMAYLTRLDAWRKNGDRLPSLGAMEECSGGKQDRLLRIEVGLCVASGDATGVVGMTAGILGTRDGTWAVWWDTGT